MALILVASWLRCGEKKDNIMKFAVVLLVLLSFLGLARANDIEPVDVSFLKVSRLWQAVR